MMGNFEIHKETEEVRHVGGAMVVFDESRVAPLFVARGIGNTRVAGVSTSQALTSQALLMPTGNDRSGAIAAGGSWGGRDQCVIGEERFWIPPEHWRDDDAAALRHRWAAK